MRLSRFTFKPGLIPSVVTFLLLPLLLGLGFWQLDRAHQKEALLTVFKAQAALPYVPIAEVDIHTSASLYRKVSVEGRYDNRHQILLDNQIHAGRPGYHIYTPLRLQGNQGAILINRGWAPMGTHRQQLPDLTVTDAKMSLKGWVAQPANPGLRLKKSDSSDSWPRVVQYMSYEQLATELGYPLVTAVVLLDPEEENGYLRDWEPHFGGFGPERHWGYAVQWFALAITLLGIYIAVNTRRNCPENASLSC